MSLGLSDFHETTKPLLRQHQVEGLEDERKRIGDIFSAPAYQTAGVDRAQAARRLRNIEKQLGEETPRAYGSGELDAAKRRGDQLLAEIRQGMPTQAEMRRNPPGAVDKHMAWERRNKVKINEWRNIQYRLHRSSPGADDGVRFERDIGNIERFRPLGGAQELSLEGAQISGKDIYLPPAGAAPTAVMSDDEEAFLAANFPGIAAMIGLASNERRAEILAEVRKLMAAPKAAAALRAPKAKKAKAARKPMTAEQKQAFKDRMARAREARTQTQQG